MVKVWHICVIGATAVLGFLAMSYVESHPELFAGFLRVISYTVVCASAGGILLFIVYRIAKAEKKNKGRQ